MPTSVLESPPVTSPPSRSRRWVVALVLALGALAVGLLVVADLGGSAEPEVRRLLVVDAVQSAAATDMLGLEGLVVGTTAVADPVTARLPDTAAFRRAGVARATIDGRRLTIEFRPESTAAQRAHAWTMLLSSPLVASAHDGTIRGGTTTASLPDMSAVQRQLDASLRATGGPPGLLAMATAPGGAWASAAGVADIKTRDAMSPSMQYRIGSTTKTFTSVVVLQLVNEGRIRLDEPVATYLPGLLPSQPITVRQLLAHTSGLVDTSHFGRLNLDATRDIPAIKDPTLRAQAERALAVLRRDPAASVPLHVYLAVVATRPLAFAPGTAYTYSNTDYAVLTMLVEKVTGRPLAAEYADRIFTPLRLTSTFLATSSDFPKPHSRSYVISEDGALIDRTDDLSLGITGSGSIVSTATDLTTFFRALLGGRLLPPKQLAEMMTPSQPSYAAGTPYGLGLAKYETPCHLTAWGHGGAIGGYLTDVYASDDGSAVAVFAENASDTRATDWLRAQVAGTAFCTAQER